MDFLARDRDDRPLFLQAPPSSSGVPDGLFAAQALRVGYLDIAGDVRRAEMARGAGSAREVLERELLKERMRGEILLREVARARLMEEEVRRELEMERAMAMRWRLEEMSASFGGAQEVSEDRVVQAQVAPKVGFEKGVLVASVGRDRSDVEKLFGEKVVGESFPRSVPMIDHEKKPAVSTLNPNAKPSNTDLCGIKRRVCELPDIAKKKTGGPPAEKDWSCALCHISATSREALNNHLQGRKHKANVELMGTAKNAGGSTSAKGADNPSLETKGNDSKESRSNTKRKRSTKAKKCCPPQKQQKTTRLWCELCKLECNSSSTLASHLGGKKHRTRLAKSQSATTKAASEKKMASEAQSSEARNEGKAKSPSADEGTGVVEDCKVEKPGTC